MGSTRRVANRDRVARPLRLVWCVSLAALSLIAVSTVAGATAAGAAHGVHAISIGNAACGKVSMTPSTNVAGGTQVAVKVHWTGSPSSSGCGVEQADCPTFWGSCNAGYWVVGFFCSTLAATNLSAAQGDCDLNNVIVLTDYNAGPNSNPDHHGTSWNQCSTVQTLGSIFGGLPGTLYCLADGDGGDNWSLHFPRGSTWGTTTGPIPATGSSVPFSPATSGVDCPPSAANIKAGAIPGMCAFVVMPIQFSYYCVADVCVPDVSLPNDGVTENTNDYLATLFQYSSGAAHHRAA